MVPGAPVAHDRCMDTITSTQDSKSRNDQTRRSGAVWISGTGAFLLVAAATLFVAVRWDTLPDEVKFAIVAGLSGAFLVAGRRLRDRIPATGSVLFHLGAFLAPVAAAATDAKIGLGWAAMALIIGVSGAVFYGALAAWSGSVVLRWVAVASVIVAATGLGGLSPVPAPLALAAVALAWSLVGEMPGSLPARRPEIGDVWALVAGVAPAIAVAIPYAADVGARGPLSIGESIALAATGPVVGATLLQAARRRADARWAWLALAGTSVPLIAGLAAAAPDGDTTLVLLAGAFVVIEVVALLAADDPLFARPMVVAAAAAEVAAGVGVLAAGAITLLVAFPDELWEPVFPDTTLGLVFGLLAVGWMVARARAVRDLGVVSGVAAGICAFGAVASASGDPVAVAFASLGVAAATLLVGRARAGLGVLAASGFALVVAWPVAGARTTVGSLAAVLAAAVAAETATRTWMRITSSSAAGAFVVGASTGVGDLMELDPSALGLALASSTVVWGVLAVLVPREWRSSFFAAAVGTLGLGLVLTSGDQTAFGVATIIAGGLVVGAGVYFRWEAVAHAGGIVATIGVWFVLDAASVMSTEAYAAPVALQLLIAGARARHVRVDEVVGEYTSDDQAPAPIPSSWVAYGPALALLGASACIERISGGAGWHAVVAGAVGVVAVAVGGWRRLAAPLFIGTGLLVAVTVYESLGAAAGVPTWMWLALGGAFLLAAGITLERSATGPIDAGRRLVDVVATRFE